MLSLTQVTMKEGAVIMTDKKCSLEQRQELLSVLKTRFDSNMHRHIELDWTKVEEKLEANPEKLWSLHEMERTGGEPDVVKYDREQDAYTFFDCAPESPIGRRSVCYDAEALESRKKNKPENSACGMAAEMGIELLNEEQYRTLQQFESVDKKTSSWIETPTAIRKLGGGLFCDFRYGTVFVYHNGVESYYAARGFRGALTV